MLSGLPRSLATLDRTVVMGVLNVTPDSFSDGGRFASVEAAIDHGVLLRDQGADVVDVGGESTRPGADRIPESEERARVIPVVEGLVARGVAVSIDTMRSSIAKAAVSAGASIVNDVSGGLADPDMFGTIADLDVACVLMHWRGPSREMQAMAVYDDVVAEVRDELGERLAAAVAAGISPDHVILDPGLGFAKESHHNWLLLRHLDVLSQLGRPLLIGASRKRFLGALLADDSGLPRAMDQRDAATDAISAIAAAHQVWGVRVHDVRGSADAVRVAHAWASASDGEST